MAEVRIDGQAHIFKIPNTHCRTRMNKKLHKKRKAEENEAKGLAANRKAKAIGRNQIGLANQKPVFQILH